MAVILILPVMNTLFLSLMSADSTSFVGPANYSRVLGDPGFLVAIRNSIVWLVALPVSSVAVGLAMAALTDRLRYGAVARAVLFVPIAISGVAAAVIWRFMFDYRPPGAAQTGTLNGILAAAGGQPQPWLISTLTANAAVIIAAVWMTAGFCMIILAAGLRAIPHDLIEAARVDGATEWQVFLRIILPLLLPTITVVATTTAIGALKAFDIVYVMTNGNFDTDVIATKMFKELFSARDYGQASAVAVILMVAIVPVMAWNIQTYKRQDAR
jgi:alpha-glucoside transport system permease protein